MKTVPYRRRILFSVTGVCAVVIAINIYLKGGALPQHKTNTLPTQTQAAPSAYRPPSEKKTTMVIEISDSASQHVRQSSPNQSDQPIILEPLRRSFATIAKDFEDNMRFPPYAKPLKSSDWALLNPRPFLPMTVPVEGIPGTSVRIEVPQYIVDIEKDLPVSVFLETAYQPPNGGEEDRDNFMATTAKISLHAHASKVGEWLLYEEKQHSERKQKSPDQLFQGQIPAEVLSLAGAGEHHIQASLTFSQGRRFTTAATIKTYRRVATLTGTENAYVQGPHLIIPLLFDVSLAGKFRIRANLINAEDNKPVSHLSELVTLQSPQDRAYLRVHAETLRAQQAPGPYRLTHFNITRVPPKPGDSVAYGSSQADSYDVSGFELHHYSDEAYEDPKMKQRLSFLQQLSEGVERLSPAIQPAE